MNRVSLVGRITKDPELRSSANNVPYVFFTIAINRLPLPNGERPTDFINCVAWNRQAENLARFIKKGGLLGIDGMIQSRQSNDQNNQPRTVMEVYCNNIEFLESKDKGVGPQMGVQQGYNPNGFNQPQGFAQPQYQQPQQYRQPQNNNFGGYNNFQNNNQAPRQNESNDNPFAGDISSQYLSDNDLPF